jgi:hypothetical protein
MRVVIHDEVGRMGGDLLQRREQIGDGTPARQWRLGNGWGLCCND